MRRWLPYFQGAQGRYVFWNHLSEKLNHALAIVKTNGTLKRFAKVAEAVQI